MLSVACLLLRACLMLVDVVCCPLLVVGCLLFLVCWLGSVDGLLLCVVRC